MKILIDRQLPLALPFMVSESESGGHPMRFDMSGKRHVIISTCGFYTAKGNYGSVNAMFDHFLEKNRYEKIYCGQGELFRVEALHNRTDEYLGYVKQAGKEFVTGGISSEIREHLDELLFPRETFEAMADASWGVSKETGEKEDETYIFTKQMASMYNKASYKGKDIVLEMDYTDEEKNYQIIFKRDGYEVRKDNFISPATKVITPFTVWKDIAAGKISCSQAMMKKLYRVEGNFYVMLNWGKYFGSGSTNQIENKNLSDKKSPKTSLMLKLIPWITFWIAAAIDSYIGGFISIGVCALWDCSFLDSAKLFMMQFP